MKLGLCPSCVGGKQAWLLLTSDLLCSNEIASALIQTTSCCTPLLSPAGPIITSRVLESGLLFWFTDMDDFMGH